MKQPTDSAKKKTKIIISDTMYLKEISKSCHDHQFCFNSIKYNFHIPKPSIIAANIRL